MIFFLSEDWIDSDLLSLRIMPPSLRGYGSTCIACAGERGLYKKNLSAGGEGRMVTEKLKFWGGGGDCDRKT